jgi:hypothetical protein
MNLENDIRIATEEDFQELFRISCLLHAEHGRHPFSETKVRHLLWRGIKQDNAIIGIIGTHSDIKAMIFLTVDPIYYSQDANLVELWNYVRPDCRRSDFAKRMIEFAKHCSDTTGCELLIGIIGDERLAAKERLYQRQLTKMGTFFVHTPSASKIEEQAA